MKNLVKNHKKLIWNIQNGFDFETDKANDCFKMDSKQIENGFKIR